MEHQDSALSRSASVKDHVCGEMRRYTVAVLDILFIAVVIAFFSAAALYVRGCARIIEQSEDGR